MTIRPGYKQTEVGVIPEDWNLTEYVSFGEIIDGDRGNNYPGFEDLQDSGHCLFLNAGNVTKNGFRFSERQFISSARDNQLNHGKLTRFDVVLTTRGTLGNFAYYDETVLFEDIRINSGMVIMRNTDPDISNFYQYLVLKSFIVKAQIEKLAFGSAQPQLTVRGISTLTIPLPPSKAEQKAIAEALSDADALIESLEQLIAKKRQIKQGAMQQLLTGQKRLQGFQASWDTKPLSEVCSMKSGVGITTANIDDYSPYRCYGGNGLRGFTSEYTHNGEHALIGRQGALCGNVLSVKGRFFASEHALVVTTKPDADISWLAYVLREMQLNQYSESSAQPGLSARKLLDLRILTPSAKDEQTAIAIVLRDMDTEITELKTKLIKARQIKQGMMQQLLTGQIRLV